jgi:hypothetical protein
VRFRLNRSNGYGSYILESSELVFIVIPPYLSPDPVNTVYYGTLKKVANHHPYKNPGFLEKPGFQAVLFVRRVLMWLDDDVLP